MKVLVDERFNVGVERGDKIVDLLVFESLASQPFEFLGLFLFGLFDSGGGLLGLWSVAPALADALTVDDGGFVEIAVAVDSFPSHRVYK